MERLFRKILPTPEKRIQVAGDGRAVFIEPGSEPFEVGQLSEKNIKGMEAFSIMVDAPFVAVDSSGVETKASRVYRAKEPLRKVKNKLHPPRLLTGEQFKEYFEEG